MKLLRRYKLLDTLALLLLAIALVGPVFKVKYLDNWPSIESTFISDARLLAGHMPHPGWQPLWYCGTRFDYIYPPALRYGTALIALAGHVSTAKAYHIYIGLTYILGIAAVYWLVLLGSRSRASAWLSACAVALVSPSLIVFHALHDDSPWMIPQRLHVLMAYGEGPHISAFSILPAALAASLVALRERRLRALALAGVLCALVVANNFYGATALALFFPILVWSVWIGLRDRSVWLRAMGIAVLAYGLSASWLTPSFLRITWTNLKFVSTPGDTSSRLVMLAAIALFCDVSWRWANRRPERIWAVFVGGSALIFTVYVGGYFYNGLRSLGEAARLAPEFDLALLLLLVFLINQLWNTRWLRAEAAVLCAVLFLPAIVYLRHAYSPFPRAANWQDRYEYRITRWVNENLHGERVMPSGTNRFWYDAWFDNAQPVGGSDQGVLNQILPAVSYQISRNESGEICALWLRALGTSAIIVPDKTSLEYYHDYPKPEKFRGLLPVIFDDQHGTVIYRVPRVYPSLGRVVDRASLAALRDMRNFDDLDPLKKYLSIVEAPDQNETPVAWSGFDALQIRASVGVGQCVLLQETYDPYWRAYENGKRLPIRRDTTMGFMLIDVDAGAHVIDMRFETPLENRVGEGLVVISLFAVIGLVVQPLRPRRPAPAA